MYIPAVISIGEGKSLIEHKLRDVDIVSYKQEGQVGDSVITVDFPSHLDGYDTWRLTFEMINNRARSITR